MSRKSFQSLAHLSSSLAHLFQRVERLQSSFDVFVVHVVQGPRLLGGRRSIETGEREEGVVAVGHVSVLGAEQKPLHDRRGRMADNRHWSQDNQHSIARYVQQPLIVFWLLLCPGH